MSACKNRYSELQGVLEIIHADLTKNADSLPCADLLVANLFIEYIGYSDSPYTHTFDCLDEVHHQMDENALTNAMGEIGYKKEVHEEKRLPNGNKLIRIDFIH